MELSELLDDYYYNRKYYEKYLNGDVLIWTKEGLEKARKEVWASKDAIENFLKGDKEK